MFNSKEFFMSSQLQWRLPKKRNIMSSNSCSTTSPLNRAIKAIAGTFIILSVLLGMYVNQNWFWFTLFVGANLLQSSFTKWCLMEDILKKLGVKDH